jgi:hypothetical protein
MRDGCFRSQAALFELRERKELLDNIPFFEFFCLFVFNWAQFKQYGEHCHRGDCSDEDDGNHPRRFLPMGGARQEELCAAGFGRQRLPRYNACVGDSAKSSQAGSA